MATVSREGSDHSSNDRSARPHRNRLKQSIAASSPGLGEVDTGKGLSYISRGPMPPILMWTTQLKMDSSSSSSSS